MRDLALESYEGGASSRAIKIGQSALNDDAVHQGEGAFERAPQPVAPEEARQKIAAIDVDGKLFPAEKLKVHEDGTQHLAISIFLFLDGKMLLQRRANGKYHSGGLWANACCSHPLWGESLEDCAVRRLEEELGSAVALRSHGVVDYYADVGDGLIENERATIFSGELTDLGSELHINQDEVQAVELFDPEQLRFRLEMHPERFAAWFREYMSRDDSPLASALRAGGFCWGEQALQAEY